MSGMFFSLFRKSTPNRASALFRATQTVLPLEPPCQVTPLPFVLSVSWHGDLQSAANPAALSDMSRPIARRHSAVDPVALETACVPSPKRAMPRSPLTEAFRSVERRSPDRPPPSFPCQSNETDAQRISL